MRSWWSEYGGYVIFGVAAGALSLFGINFYQNSQEKAQLEASALYESLTDYVVEGDLDDAEQVSDQLGTDYEGTIYAAQSKLAIARMYLDKNRDQDAADALRELLDSAADEELKQVARLRLARILLYQDKPEDVVLLLEGRDDPAFVAAFGEASWRRVLRARPDRRSRACLPGERCSIRCRKARSISSSCSGKCWIFPRWPKTTAPPKRQRTCRRNHRQRTLLKRARSEQILASCRIDRHRLAAGIVRPVQ